MKIIILIISILIIISPHPDLPICNIQTAKQAIAPRIFAETTIDGPAQNVLFTRFLHNKVGIFGSEFAVCYSNVLNPLFLAQSTNYIGLIALLYFAYFITKNKRYILISIFFALPTLYFFSLPLDLIVLIYKFFAIIGLIKLIRKIW